MLPLALAAGLSVGALPAFAQYKVVAPDGRVTYTDRAPADTTLKVTEIGARREAPAAAVPALPADLQRLAERYPVTLMAAPNCEPCESGRSFLKQRGIPYSERLVLTQDDAQALERVSGGRTLPSLTIGEQSMRGFSSDEWAAYLDAAGYPRTSRLPPAWAAAPATPLVARAPVPSPAEPTPTAAPRPSTPPPKADLPGTIRF